MKNTTNKNNDTANEIKSPDISPAAKTLRETGNRLTLVLEHNEVSDDIKEALKTIFFEAASEAEFNITEPESIKSNFSPVMESLDPKYARAYVSSIRSIMDINIPMTVTNEILDRLEAPYDLTADIEEALKAINEEPANPTNVVPLVSNKPETGDADKIKIVPTFEQLTPKGIEMYTKMGDIRNARLFVDDLVMEIGDDHTTIAGLVAILQAVRTKVENDDCTDSAIDYICDLQRRFFQWTIEHERCVDAYVEAVTSGNFVVEKLVFPKSESKNEFSEQLKAVA